MPDRFVNDVTNRRSSTPGRGSWTGRNSLHRLGGILAVATLVAMVSWSPAANASNPATVSAATNATFGTILTNAQGFALYIFPNDKNGISSCTGPCATIWPALTVPGGTTPTAGPGVTGTVAAVVQSNGTHQVTYNGSPLYTFYADSAPGQVTGNDVGGFKVALMAALQAVSSVPGATIAAGSSFSFPVTTTGTPSPKVKDKGKLPKGVKFDKGIGTATLSGTPTSTKHKSAVGTYHITILATFGKGATKNVVTQAFTLTVTP